MDSRKIVFKETAIASVGHILVSAAVVGVFALLGRFSMPVLWGAIAGCLIMIVNYFFMDLTISLAADKAERGNPKAAQTMIQLSGVVRLAVMGVLLVVGIKLGANVIALALPLLFARPILLLVEFFRKKD